MRMVSSRFVLFLLFTRWNPCFLFIRWRNFVHFNYQKDSSSFTLEAAWASKQFLQNKQEEVDSTFSLREKRPKGVCNIFCGPIFAKLCAEKNQSFWKFHQNVRLEKQYCFETKFLIFTWVLWTSIFCLFVWANYFQKFFFSKWYERKKKDFDWYSNVFSISSQFKEKKKATQKKN